MSKHYLLITLLVISGCSGTKVYMGAGHDLNPDHVGNNPVAVFGVDQKITEDSYCGWLHVSNIFDGIPFNNREENVSDIIHCGAEYKFK